jgi:hypothetical protein
MSGNHTEPPKSDCCGTDDCCDQQASLISANAGVSALGINICVDVDIGGGLPTLPELPDCIPDLGVV